MEEVIPPEKRQLGRDGEQAAREYFRSRGYRAFQADWIVYNPHTKEDVLLEVKHQECFKKPPFDGHGLPIWQVKVRLAFEKRHNIRAYLFILDAGTDIIYGQWISTLEKGKHYDTTGKSPRRIYPLESYQILGSHNGND